MKKLLLIVPSLCLGGQERVCAKTAEIMKSAFDVKLIIFDSKDAVYTPDCEVYNINVPAKNGKLNKIINVIKRIYLVKKIRKKENADYVYSFGATANLVNVLSKSKGQAIIGIREFLGARKNNILNKIIYSNADKIIGCSKGVCETINALNKKYKDKTFCLYNPIDLENVYKLGSEPVSDYNFNGTTIITHGRLDVVKNWPRLIKAFSLVKNQIGDSNLIIIGEGDQRQYLEKLIEKYKMQDIVHLIGFRANPFSYIAKSNLYVLPSYSEGFPNALIEGMAFVPAISVNCKTGPSEIMADKANYYLNSAFCECDSGILVKDATVKEFTSEITEDDKNLAEAILHVLKNPEKLKEIKENGARRVTEFSCDAYCANLTNILEE